MDIQVCDNAQMINGKRTCQIPSNQSNKYKMTVEIKDKNDNAPVFKNSNYQFTVSELADTDTDVGEIEVADADIDPANQHTNFYFNEYNDIFKISTDSSGTTGKIRIKQKGKLDYETKKTYRFTVNAKNTDPEMSRVSQTTVQINIKDENEPPIFEKSSYELEIEEGEVNQRGFESILVKAEDRDQIGTADQQRVTYSIKPGSNTVNWFEINQTTGELRVNMPVDREARPYPNAETNPRNGRYPVTVTACDNYRPQACADQVVYVNVKDKNDNHPTFWKDGSFKTSIRVTACQNVRSVYNQDGGWFKIDNALVTIIDKDNDLNSSPFRVTIDNSEMSKHFKLEKNNRFQPAAGMNAEQFYLMTKLTELAKPDSGHVYQIPVVLKDRHNLATPEKSHQIEISSCR